MALVSCVVCDQEVPNSRERRVLLDPRTNHVVPYLQELAKLLDSSYEFALYFDKQQSPHYICKRCFMECEKGMKYESKAQESRKTVSSCLNVRLAKRKLASLNDADTGSDTDSDISAPLPKQLRLEDNSPVASSACRRLTFPQGTSETGSPTVTVCK